MKLVTIHISNRPLNGGPAPNPITDGVRTFVSCPIRRRFRFFGPSTITDRLPPPAVWP